MNKVIKILLLILLPFGAFGIPTTIDSIESPKKETSKFKPANFIFEHIQDSFEWHIVTINGHKVSIPLPMILYSKDEGLCVFMSNKFDNDLHIYKSFKLEEEGKYEGKVVNINKNGEINEANPLPLNISITKDVLSILMMSILLCLVFITVANRYKKNPDRAPKGIQNLFEPIIIFVRDEIAKPSIGEKKYYRYMPFLLSLFFFIWFTNLFGIIPIFPGGANVTGNIAVTMVLALFTFFVVNISASRNYWKEIVNASGVPWFLKIPIPIMPLVEFTGIFTKPFVLMIRLFANMLAGHMVQIVFMCLIFIFSAIKVWLGYTIAPISIVFSVFMSLLELLVALIQAYVFTLLSAIYIGMAVSEHH